MPDIDVRMVDELLAVEARIAAAEGLLRLCGLSPAARQALARYDVDGRLHAFADRSEAVLGRAATPRPRLADAPSKGAHADIVCRCRLVQQCAPVIEEQSDSAGQIFFAPTPQASHMSAQGNALGEMSRPACHRSPARAQHRYRRSLVFAPSGHRLPIATTCDPGRRPGLNRFTPAACRSRTIKSRCAANS